MEESVSPGRSSRLCTYEKGKVDLVFPLNENVLWIGRSPENAVTLVDESVSRRHARLVKKGEEWEIEDLESANGTRVNGVAVRSAKLKDGDRIEVGSTTLRLELNVRDGEWVPTYAFDLSSQHSHKTMINPRRSGN